MELLAAEFDDAVKNVTISGDKEREAIAAHTEIRQLLEEDPQLKAWGIDTILIGSYARQTSRYPGNDVDVFLRFMELSVLSDPSEVYERVSKVLTVKYGLKEFGGRVTLQPRSVKVDFTPSATRPDLAFSVDAVPAVPFGDDWAIPNRDRSSWGDMGARWIKTNPVRFAGLSDELSTANWSPTVGGRNAYKLIVRLLRQVRHVQLGESKPGGLYTEVAAYYAWHERLVGGSSWAEILESSLRQVSIKFRNAAEQGGLRDVVLGTALSPELRSEEWRSAADVFLRCADLGAQAMESSKCMSAKLWRGVLGSNDRGQVLRLPDGCDAEGNSIPKVTAISSTGTNSARGFAASVGG